MHWIKNGVKNNLGHNRGRYVLDISFTSYWTGIHSSVAWCIFTWTNSIKHTLDWWCSILLWYGQYPMDHIICFRIKMNNVQNIIPTYQESSQVGTTIIKLGTGINSEVYIDVVDGRWRRNGFATTLRCWWRFWPFTSLTSYFFNIFLGHQNSKIVTDILSITSTCHRNLYSHLET